MLDFGSLPPEINSGRLYFGPGSGPILAAAGAWDGVAADLGWAASAYGSVISGLTSQEWKGPASASMAGAVAPYVTWMQTTAVQAEQAANQARAAAGAYETAFGATVPPPVIAANRSQLVSLIATNFFGQNAPAIAATEAQYGEMWAQDAAAMYGYAGSSAVASTLTPFTAAPTTTDTAGLAGQAAAVANVAGASAGASAPTTQQLISALLTALEGLLFPASSTSSTPSPWSLQAVLPQVLSFFTTGSTDNALTNYGYFPVGTFNSLLGVANGLAPAKGAPSAGLLPPPAAALGASGVGGAGLGGSPAAVSASFAEAGTIGRLSVPQSWAAAAAAPATSPAVTAAAPVNQISAAAGGGPAGFLRGIPLAGAAKSGSRGFVHRYGFRHSVIPRPPAAG